VICDIEIKTKCQILLQQHVHFYLLPVLCSFLAYHVIYGVLPGYFKEVCIVNLIAISLKITSL
jgi:hypothetical protein